MRWRFTDKVLDFVPWHSIVTLKAGSLEEYSLLERWGSPGEAPAILTLEACIHSARWLVEASSAFRQTLAPLEISHWRALEGLRPGERLRVNLSVEERSGERIRFKAHYARLRPGQESASVERSIPASDAADLLFDAMLMPLAEYALPQDREHLWRELTA